jgi:hypothetical protein
VLEATDWLKQYVGRVKGTLDPIETVGDRQPVGDEQPEEQEGEVEEAQGESADVAADPEGTP